MSCQSPPLASSPSSMSRTIDYRMLLLKYISHVLDQEGATFISSCRWEIPDTLVLTPDEWALLAECEIDVTQLLRARRVASSTVPDREHDPRPLDNNLVHHTAPPEQFTRLYFDGLVSPLADDAMGAGGIYVTLPPKKP